MAEGRLSEFEFKTQGHANMAWAFATADQVDVNQMLFAAWAKVVGYLVQLALVVRAYRAHEPEGERLRWILGGSDVAFVKGWVSARYQ